MDFNKIGGFIDKQKGFAIGCSREVIERGAEQLGWEFDKVLTMTLQAMAANEDIINSEMAAEEYSNFKKPIIDNIWIV